MRVGTLCISTLPLARLGPRLVLGACIELNADREDATDAGWLLLAVCWRVVGACIELSANRDDATDVCVCGDCT